MTVTSPTDFSNPGTSKARYGVALIAAPTTAVLLAMAAGFVPTRSLGGHDAVTAMAIAGGMSVLATILGSIPVIWASLRSPEKVPTAALGATLLRVVLLGAMAAPVAAYGGLPLRPLLLWVAISYLVALGAESVVVILLVRRMEARR